MLQGTKELIRKSGYLLLSLIYLGLSQLPVVQSGRVRTFSGSIFAQESKSEVGVCKITQHCARTKTLFKTLSSYLSSQLSNLGV